jgi:phosphate acyltransferase
MVQSVSSNHSVIIDAMGGDFAPGEIIKGSAEAKKDLNADIKLVGDLEKIKKSADLENIDISGIDIIPTSQEVRMDESPSYVLKNKRDSSICRGSEFTAGQDRAAFISAGNTGAVMACSLFNIKRIENIARPAIAVVVPLGDRKFVLIDAGANADCKPLYLKQFAIMGKVYSENILGIKKPRVSLVNIGEEEKKGNELVVESYRLIKECPDINFIGNVEGRELFEGITDVAVCDGFVGNVILKLIEGMAGFFFKEIRQILESSVIAKISALGIRSSLVEMRKKFDYEEYGGAQLLGLNRPVIISHGSSRSKAVKNAVKVAMESLELDIANKIRKEISGLN